MRLRFTNVMLCWIKHGELLGKDVVFNSKDFGGKTCDVEFVLSQNNTDLRREGAVREDKRYLSVITFIPQT